MKLNTNFSSHQEMVGAQESHALRINDSSQAMIIDSLINLYSDPVGSIVRELTSNAIDSHRERDLKRAGQIPLSMEEDLKWFDDRLSVEVALVDSNPLIGIDANITFSDFGMGLSPQRVKDIYTVLGTSTKRDDNHQIGGFGLGCKSPWAYTDSFYVNTRFNGTEYYYLMHKGESVPSMDLVFTQATDKKNGTSVIVPLKADEKSHEIAKFIYAINEQLVFFKNVSYVGDFESYRTIRKPDIVEETEHFVITKNIAQDSSYPQLLVGNVLYPLDTSMLDNPTLLPSMITKVGIGEIDLVPSREAVRYTPRTIAAIEAKLELIKQDAITTVQNALNNVTDLKDFLTYKANLKAHYYTQTIGKCDNDLVCFKYQLASDVKLNADLSKWDLDIDGVDYQNMWCAFRMYEIRSRWSRAGDKITAKPISMYNNFKIFKQHDTYHVEKRFNARTNMALQDTHSVAYCFKEVRIADLPGSEIRDITDEFPHSFEIADIDAALEKVRTAIYKHFKFHGISKYEDVDTSKFASVTLSSEETTEQRRKRLGKVFAKRYYNAGQDYTANAEYLVADLLSKAEGGKFIYGFSADAEKLAIVKAIVKNDYIVVRISKQNEKHFTRQIHVDDFIAHRQSEMIESAQKSIDDNYTHNALKNYNSRGPLQFVNKAYYDMVKTPCPDFYATAEKVNKIIPLEPSADIIAKVGRVKDFFKKLPILSSAMAHSAGGDAFLMESIAFMADTLGIPHEIQIKRISKLDALVKYYNNMGISHIVKHYNNPETQEFMSDVRNADGNSDLREVFIKNTTVEYVDDLDLKLKRYLGGYGTAVVLEEENVNQFALSL